ncbi:MAG: RNA polymerase factor sigma-54 [Planctomycetota bacterium]
MEQRLIQSPQMIQAMQILQLPLLELSERIAQELSENPFLEEAEASASATAATEGGDAAESPASDTAEQVGADAMLEVMERLERDYGDGSRVRASGGDDEGDRKYEAMLNAPEDAASLQEAILAQLAALDLAVREREILEHVVWSLDERGYLTETPSTLAAELTLERQRTLSVPAVLADDDEALPSRTPAGPAPGNGAVIVDDAAPAIAPDDDPRQSGVTQPDEAEPDDPIVTEDEVRDALERLRENVHPGLGALDLSECLLLQLPSQGLWNSPVRALIENHLDDVRTNRLPQIAKAMGEDLETVKAAIELMKGLDPQPGAGFGDVHAEVIHPEVMVALVDGDVDCKLERGDTPRLRISPLYQTQLIKKMLKEGTKEEREFAKKRLESASWLIDAIAQRESTLSRIAKAVFEHQRGFLERGAEALKPLRMQEIADEVGVHISTVSRAVAGKYAQTPRGIFALKFFFVGGTTKSSGEEASQISIKEHIKRIVAAEDSSKPLSDEAIAKALEESDGIKIARRTVTKYRKALEIPSSTERKSY